MSSLAEGLPEQQQRVRGLITQYHELQREFGQGVNVAFAVAVCEQALQMADRAVMSGDVVEMLRSYEALKELQ